MPEQIVMPKLSDTMTEGTITKWLKHPGDAVQKGEPLVEVETDKANIELESFVSGRLSRIILEEGQSAPVGDLIGEIALPGDPADGDAPSTAAPAQPEAKVAAAEAPAASTLPAAVQEAPKPAAQAQPAGKVGSQAAPATANHRLRVSPLARRLARERGLDLSAIQGSGPLGRIQKDDVEAAAARGGVRRPAPAGPESELLDLTRVQKVIARRMVEAKSQVPHFYVSMDVDMGPAVELLEALNEDAAKEQVITINDFFIRACGVALRDFPEANSFYEGDQIRRNNRVHIGFAVAAPGALIVPVVQDADRKDLAAIAADTKRLVAKVRAGKIEPADYEGGTFSISNLGMYGVTEFSAIINPPQSAILAIGAAEDRAVVKNGQIVVAKRATLTLSADHRVLYGANAAEFLRGLKKRIEKPLGIILQA